MRNFKVVSRRHASAKSCSTFSDDDFLVSYSIIETPQPITNHKATLQLRRVTDGDRTYAEWTASFDAPADEADEVGQGHGRKRLPGRLQRPEEPFRRVRADGRRPCRLRSRLSRRCSEANAALKAAGTRYLGGGTLVVRAANEGDLSFDTLRALDRP